MIKNMQKFSKFLTVLAFFTVFSCSSSLQRLSEKENVLKMEGFYSSYLALEYLEYSRSLLRADNRRDSEYFAKKGEGAALGYLTILEDPYFWNAPQLELEDLVTAQKRYQAVATDEIKTLLPIQMAHLTFLYDCWVSKESKPAYRLGEMARCKSRFYALLEEIEYFAAHLGDEGEQTKIIEAIFERFDVYFDFDKYKINEKANKKLVEILNKIDALDGNYSVILVGNADRMGKNLYNENLALNRARVVRQYLRANGVPKHLIEIKVEGEEFPDLITRNQVQQQLNRTTQVYLLHGVKTPKDIPLPVIRQQSYQQEIAKSRKNRGL